MQRVFDDPTPSARALEGLMLYGELSTLIFGEPGAAFSLGAEVSHGEPIRGRRGRRRERHASLDDGPPLGGG